MKPRYNGKIGLQSPRVYNAEGADDTQLEEPEVDTNLLVEMGIPNHGDLVPNRDNVNVFDANGNGRLIKIYQIGGRFFHCTVCPEGYVDLTSMRQVIVGFDKHEPVNFRFKDEEC